MKEKIMICVEKIINEAKKYKNKKRQNIALAVMLNFIVLAELVLTGMTFEHGYMIEIYVDGGIIKRHTHAETFGKLISDEGIILGEHDELSISPDTAIDSDGELIIKRVVYVDRSVSEPVPFETIYETNPLYAMGTEFTSVEGKTGCKTTTYTEKIVDGVIAESRISSTDYQQPVDKIVTVGSAHSEPYSKRQGDYELKDGVPTEYAYMVSGKVTAYTAPPGSGTYSGRPLEIGTVAVNPDIIPFGSELYICSKDGKRVYGYAVAADTGDLTEVVADVFMGLTSEHYSDACAWGAQDSYVYVLTVGDNSVSWM